MCQARTWIPQKGGKTKSAKPLLCSRVKQLIKPKWGRKFDGIQQNQVGNCLMNPMGRDHEGDPKSQAGLEEPQPLSKIHLCIYFTFILFYFMKTIPTPQHPYEDSSRYMLPKALLQGQIRMFCWRFPGSSSTAGRAGGRNARVRCGGSWEKCRAGGAAHGMEAKSR